MIPFIPKRRKEFGFGSKRFYHRLLIMTALPVLNLILTFTVRDPNCPRGYLGPGPAYTDPAGYHLSQCAGGANLYIDKMVLGAESIPTGEFARCSYIFGCKGFNQEGVLGTLNFLFGAYLGALVGEFHTQYRRKIIKQMNFFAKYAALCAVVAIAMGVIPGLQFVPVNNQVWSVTYVLCGNVLSIGFFAILKFLSQRGVWLGWPFKSVGKNAIFIIFVQQMMRYRFPFGYHNNGNYFDSTLSSLLSCTVIVVVAIFLHKFRFYIKY